MTPLTSPQEVYETVRAGYARIATAETSDAAGCGCGPSSCCGADPNATADELAQTIGYSIEELQALPEGANMGLSCGNPTALASLLEGETVLDLGSGGGFDVFVAGRRVGPTGRVIGVDMTPEMLAKARRNTLKYRETTGLDNVEFRLGEIENLPLPDASVDVVISNCVLNLSPNKPRVWREIARVLKPGGRVAVSDLALLRPLPESVKERVEALVGCIAGAALISDVEKMMQDAGLKNIRLEPKSQYVGAMEDSKDELYQGLRKDLPEGTTSADFVTSLDISARKPLEAARCC